MLSLYIGYVNAETLTLFGCGTAWIFGAQNSLLGYGIGTWCQKRPPTVRDAFSEALGVQNRLLWYGRDIRCAEQPPTVRNAFSRALGVKNKHFWYGRDIRYRKPPPTVRNEATGCGHCVAGSGLRIRLLQEWFRRWHNVAAITDGVCFDGFVGKAQRLQRCCGESR